MSRRLRNQLPRTRCVLPTGFSVFHPAYLPPSLRRQIRNRFDRRGIFLNIPYAADYSKLEIAIISTVTAYGLNPVMAKQRVRFDIRFVRILEMVTTCAFGFTDLSYPTRMNMPLELGLMLALGKNSFIAGKRRYSAHASISDLNLGDIRYHEGRPRDLIRDFSRWIETNCSRKRITLKELIERYETFMELRKYLGVEEFDRLSPQEIFEVLQSARRRFKLRIVGRV